MRWSSLSHRAVVGHQMKRLEKRFASLASTHQDGDCRTVTKEAFYSQPEVRCGGRQFDGTCGTGGSPFRQQTDPAKAYSVQDFHALFGVRPSPNQALDYYWPRTADGRQRCSLYRQAAEPPDRTKLVSTM